MHFYDRILDKTMDIDPHRDVTGFKMKFVSNVRFGKTLYTLWLIFYSSFNPGDTFTILFGVDT